MMLVARSIEKLVKSESTFKEIRFRVCPGGTDWLMMNCWKVYELLMMYLLWSIDLLKMVPRNLEIL